jgi:uncharacterized protein (TIGR03118 family)
MLAALVVGVLAVAAPLQAEPGNKLVVTPLISDQPGVAPVTDPNLVNAWGLTSSATSPWWVSDQGTSKSTLYTGAGAINPLVVNVVAAPTGVVFAGIAGQFQVGTTAAPTTLAPANFVFAALDGKIHAWRAPTDALVVADQSSRAAYTGLAIAGTGSAARIYAANFRGGTVDVFDGSWTLVTAPGAFTDPKLPDGYVPYGIQTSGSRIFVTYATKGANGRANPARGQGIVDVYDTSGALLHRVASHGAMAAPWGLAMAPTGFGRFGGDLLVGQFGTGEIHALKEQPDGSWKHDGALNDTRNRTIVIDGLWALEFAQGGTNGTPGTLYFTAGPVQETHGLFGKIAPAP